ncbi:MAG: hypothetical protein P4L81_03140 [Candidatus Pacebacteria bacterium]|nr:hypothetical protein [Candidatus Paceibacterota bacterium]
MNLDWLLDPIPQPAAIAIWIFGGIVALGFIIWLTVPSRSTTGEATDESVRNDRPPFLFF